MPARDKHLPTHRERIVLQRLRVRDELSAKDLEPSTHRTILRLMAKGWIERGSSAGRYRITSAGNEAMRAPLPDGLKAKRG
jgi:hypothetical protein